jgi:hypothetical protein
MSVANTLAHYDKAAITAVKRFIVHRPQPHFVNSFKKKISTVYLFALTSLDQLICLC